MTTLCLEPGGTVALNRSSCLLSQDLGALSLKARSRQLVNTTFKSPTILAMVSYRFSAFALLALRAIGAAATSQTVSSLLNRIATRS